MKNHFTLFQLRQTIIHLGLGLLFPLCLISQDLDNPATWETIHLDYGIVNCDEFTESINDVFSGTSLDTDKWNRELNIKKIIIE